MTENTTAAPPPTHHDSAERARPTTLAEIRGLTTIYVSHPTEPSAAGLLGIGRSLAFRMADEGEIPTIRLGGRRLALVLPLRRMLGDLPPLHEGEAVEG